jgi:hypothetical protein
MVKLPTHSLSLLFSEKAGAQETLSPRDIKKAAIEELAEHYCWYDYSQRRLSII